MKRILSFCLSFLYFFSFNIANAENIQSDSSDNVFWTFAGTPEPIIVGPVTPPPSPTPVPIPEELPSELVGIIPELDYVNASYEAVTGYGLLVQGDYEAAIKWFEKSPENVYAQACLGGLYDNGIGVKQDYYKAVDWYEKAADQGSIFAQYKLEYWGSLGVSFNRSELIRHAKELFQVPEEDLDNFIFSAYRLTEEEAYQLIMLEYEKDVASSVVINWPEELIDTKKIQLADELAYELGGTDLRTIWLVTACHKEHPEWVYCKYFDTLGGAVSYYDSPFDSPFDYYGWFLIWYGSAGEESLFHLLCEAKRQKWFENWSADSHQEIINHMNNDWPGMFPSPLLLEGLKTNMQAGEAMHELFVSVFGDEAGWSEAIWQWHDSELAAYNLEYAGTPVLKNGSVTYEVPENFYSAKCVTRFAGSIPEQLTLSFQHPELDGWTCLCGAYVESADGINGLAAFEKNNERILVSFNEAAVLPISEATINSDCDMQILLNPYSYWIDGGYPSGPHWIIEYSRSSTEKERFYVDSRNWITLYTKTDRSSGNGIVIRPVDYYDDLANVFVFENRQLVEQKAVYQVFPSVMTAVEVEKFTNLDNWLNEQKAYPPEGYAVITDTWWNTEWEIPELKKDLHYAYDNGVLAKLLEKTEDGDYRIQVGEAQGIISGELPGPSAGGSWPYVNNLLMVGKLKQDVALKRLPTQDSEILAELSAGTLFRLLHSPDAAIENDGWMQISIPSQDISMHMQPDEMIGYIKLTPVSMSANGMEYAEVIFSSSILNLEWMEVENIISRNVNEFPTLAYADATPEVLELYRKATQKNDSEAQYNLGSMYEFGENVEQDYTKALEWYQKAAEQDYVYAQLSLGSIYGGGFGVEQDYDKALEWYEKAAKDNAFAQNRLGDAYYFGSGMEQDYVKAAEWYQKAADQDYTFSQIMLAEMYEQGLGVEQNYSQAYNLYMKAAEKEYHVAQYALGNMHYFGRGVKQEYTKAAEWFQKAAGQNHVSAQYDLGIMFYNGRGVEQDYGKAAEWFQKAAEQNHVSAQYNLGIMFYNGRGVEQDYGKAAEWFQKAAEQNHVSAQYNLGVMFYYGRGVEQDYTKAAEWYQKAAEQSEVYAQNYLGYMFEYGQGVEQDYVKAVEWYQKAAEQGHVTAQSNLGYMYEHGKGVEQDYAKAAELYQKAAQQGNAFAQNNLGNMYRYGLGVEKNLDVAYEWYKKAASQGMEEAIAVLAENPSGF